jgi:hypothetical protein
MRAGARLFDRGTRRNPEFSNLCGAVPPSLPTNLALLLAGEAAHMRTYSKRVRAPVGLVDVVMVNGLISLLEA